MEILLLHGAVGSAKQLEPLHSELSKDHTVHSINFMGHGGEPVTTNFSIERFAEQVINWVNENKGEPLCLFGYSMGGYVAMYIARHFPELIDKIITLGTKFHWDVQTAEREIKMLDPEIIEEKIPAFAKTLQERHQPNNWKVILKETAKMLLELGNDNPIKLREYSTIQMPCLVLLGDMDKMVTQVETFSVYNELPNAQLGILPGTPHAIEQVDIDLLVSMTRNFLRAAK